MSRDSALRRWRWRNPWLAGGLCQRVARVHRLRLWRNGCCACPRMLGELREDNMNEEKILQTFLSGVGRCCRYKGPLLQPLRILVRFKIFQLSGAAIKKNQDAGGNSTTVNTRRQD